MPGYGEQNGGIMTMIYNEADFPLTTIVMETFPWYLRIFLQSLKIETFPISSSVVGKSGQVLKPGKLAFPLI